MRDEETADAPGATAARALRGLRARAPAQRRVLGVPPAAAARPLPRHRAAAAHNVARPGVTAAPGLGVLIEEARREPRCGCPREALYEVLIEDITEAQDEAERDRAIWHARRLRRELRLLDEGPSTGSGQGET